MDTFRKVRGATLLTLGLLVLSSGAAAQDIKQGDSEVVGYAGGIWSGSAFVVGGGYGYGIRPHLQLLGEFGFVTRSGVHGFEFHGDVAYTFPLKPYPKFTPYALAGFGLGHQSCNFLGINCGATTAGFDFGGGARWQVGKNWGIRPEVKFLAGNHFGTRLSGGVYYEFGK
jgi:hypothetical protein